jgi:hypothetical protein
VSIARDSETRIKAASISFLKCSHRFVSSETMDDELTPAGPHDVETALALALTSGRGLAPSQSAEPMSKVVAERLVAALKSSGFVVMGKPIPAIGAGDNPGRGFHG